jgi:hypothetical protein
VYVLHRAFASSKANVSLLLIGGKHNTWLSVNRNGHDVSTVLEHISDESSRCLAFPSALASTTGVSVSNSSIQSMLIATVVFYVSCKTSGSCTANDS